METHAVPLGEVRTPCFVHSIAEAEVLSDLSRSTLYRLIKAGRLRTVRVGGRRLIPVAELARLCGALGSHT